MANIFNQHSFIHSLIQWINQFGWLFIEKSLLNSFSCPLHISDEVGFLFFSRQKHNLLSRPRFVYNFWSTDQVIDLCTHSICITSLIYLLYIRFDMYFVTFIKIWLIETVNWLSSDIRLFSSRLLIYKLQRTACSFWFDFIKMKFVNIKCAHLIR